MYKKEKPQMQGFVTLVFTTFYDKEKESDCQAENGWHHADNLRGAGRSRIYPRGMRRYSVGVIPVLFLKWAMKWFTFS